MLLCRRVPDTDWGGSGQGVSARDSSSDHACACRSTAIAHSTLALFSRSHCSLAHSPPQAPRLSEPSMLHCSRADSLGKSAFDMIDLERSADGKPTPKIIGGMGESLNGNKLWFGTVVGVWDHGTGALHVVCCAYLRMHTVCVPLVVSSTFKKHPVVGTEAG